MGWSLIRMARYVKQSKYLQQLKENEEVWSHAFPNASYLMFSKDRAFLTSANSPKNPLKNKINWRSYEEVQPYCTDIKKSSIVLGVDEDFDEKALFACSINPDQAEEIQEKYEGRFTDTRMSVMTLPVFEANIIGRGYTMVTWNTTAKYCPYCAGEMEKQFSGCLRVCSKSCDPVKKNQYPPIFPVAITRVLDHTNEKALLVRQPRHPKGMYSCIAGFMEPGETLQDCVRREIAEEAGIVVDNINYFQSQTWAIPQASLMLGCTAIAMDGSKELNIDKMELEDAKWLTRAEVKDALDRVRKDPNILRNNPDNLLIIPPYGSIAHDLMRNWVEDYLPTKL